MNDCMNDMLSNGVLQRIALAMVLVSLATETSAAPAVASKPTSAASAPASASSPASEPEESSIRLRELLRLYGDIKSVDLSVEQIGYGPDGKALEGGHFKNRIVADYAAGTRRETIRQGNKDDEVLEDVSSGPTAAVRYSPRRHVVDVYPSGGDDVPDLRVLQYQLASVVKNRQARIVEDGENLTVDWIAKDASPYTKALRTVFKNSRPYELLRAEMGQTPDDPIFFVEYSDHQAVKDLQLRLPSLSEMRQSGKERKTKTRVLQSKVNTAITRDDVEVYLPAGTNVRDFEHGRNYTMEFGQWILTTEAASKPASAPGASRPAASTASAPADDGIPELMSQLQKELAAAVKRAGLDPAEVKLKNGRIEFAHNCVYWGKQGYEEKGANAIYLSFWTCLESELVGEFHFPSRTWKNLSRWGWADRHFGKDVDPKLSKELEALVEAYFKKIDGIDQSAAPTSAPATRPAHAR